MPEWVGRRYSLEEQLGQGGMGVVYRAVDRLTGNQVALKKVIPPSESLEGDVKFLRLALAQEFKLLATLRHPHIISVLDYGFEASPKAKSRTSKPFIIMDLLTNFDTILAIGKGQTDLGKAELLIQMLQALDYVHRRSILHRDLKPGNVVVTGGQVKILDFGLATLTHQMDTDYAVGSLAYMAPEVLRDEAPTAAADLYAVGVIAYQMFAGKHPFDTLSMARLVSEILNTAPDLTPLPSSVSAIIGRLLTKYPHERYSSAAEVIIDLSTAFQRPPPPETIAIRESFLQTATFVGREAELAQLSAALEQTLAGQGGAWLVGGESGVGKSRLVEELRILALTQGAPVVRGQAIREQAAPYSVWREVLRWLALLDDDLTDLEAEVLKGIVPELPYLLNRPVKDAPELDPQTTRERLLSIIEALLRRRREPLVILLEDFHWASAENLALFNRLAPHLKTLPILLIATYRDDEQPAYPQQLPHAQVMRLLRLSEESIAALSESMLGENGRMPTVVNLLQHESEGNVFFLIEVVRALAETAGQLNQIGFLTLPNQVFAGGIQQVVQRRLERVPPEDQPLLQLAAVAGRNLDLNLLGRFSAGLDDWLTRCANAAVLDANEGGWRFSHDKLREKLLADLPDKPALHRQIAEGIEALYPDASDKVAALVQHWTSAGDEPKELEYRIKAGVQSYIIGSHQAAMADLERAFVLQEKHSSDEVQKAYIHTRLGACHYALGDLQTALPHFEQAVALIGLPIPKGRALLWGILNQIRLQVWYRLREKIPIPRRYETRYTMRRYVEDFTVYLTAIYYLTNANFEPLYMILRTANRAEKYGAASDGGVAYTVLGFGLGLLGWRRLPNFYLRRGLKMVQATPDSPRIASSLHVDSVFRMANGDWETAGNQLQRAVELTRTIGSQRMEGEVLSYIAERQYYLGNFAQAQAGYQELLDLSQRTDNKLQQVWGYLGRGISQARQGLTEAAIADFHATLALLENLPPTRSNIVCHAMLGAAYWRAGQQAHALAHIQLAEKVMAEVSRYPNGVFLLDAYSSLAEVYFKLWADDPQWEEAARKACRNMQAYAKRFPIGQPRALYYQGELAGRLGKPDQARQLWQQALRAAQRLGMAYDEGLARERLEP